jgi:sulfur carrier protein
MLGRMRDAARIPVHSERGDIGPATTGGPDPVAPGDAGSAADGRIAVIVNGQPEAVARGATVADVVRAWCPSPDGIAVACNREVVPRGEWAARPLAPADHVEIVTAAAGG